MYIVVRGSDHYAPPTREVRGNYSNDGINHVSPQEAFIIIEILAPPSSPSSFPFLSFPFLSFVRYRFFRPLFPPVYSPPCASYSIQLEWLHPPSRNHPEEYELSHAFYQEIKFRCSRERQLSSSFFALTRSKVQGLADSEDARISRFVGTPLVRVFIKD